MCPTWKCAFGSKAHGQDSHENLVGHGVDHGSDDRLLVPSPGDISIDEVSKSGIREESDGPGMVVMQDKIADDWSGHKTGEGEEVWDGVDILVGCELGQNIEKRLLGFRV